MFESLKKKLKGWLGTEEKAKTPKKKVSKPKKTSKKQAKPKKEKKAKKSLVPKLEEKTVKPHSAPVIEEVPSVIVEEPEKKGFFSRFTEKFTTSTITKEQVEESFYELELILLENNVALDVVDKIREELVKNLAEKEAKKSNLQKMIVEALKKAIGEVLHEPPDIIEKIKAKKGVFVILFFGINGTGKTTSLAKLAHLLKKNKISCVLAAGDTFRAASIEQLEKHGSNLDLKVIRQEYGTDPTAVAFDAKKYAEKNGIKCVLIDTAGRMYTKENLLKEMEKMIRVIQPDLKLFVGESITGNDAIEQARTFQDVVGIDGIILSKADVDDKGGTALSVSYITKKPIYFLGIGQTYDDLKPFKKEDILKNLGLD